MKRNKVETSLMLAVSARAFIFISEKGSVKSATADLLCEKVSANLSRHQNA
jgi:hypothetical protein